MTKTSIRRPLAGCVASACAVAILALTGCGGGESGSVDDHGKTSTSVHMNCGSACVQSDTVATAGLVAHFYIEDDGKRTQAQAGFYSGFTLIYNVELNGDSLYYVQDGVATQMGLSVDTRLGPYLVDFARRATAPVTGQFELRRPTQTYASTVTLPAPFDIASPQDGAVYSTSSNAIPLQLDSARPEAAWSVVNATCKDTGNVTHVALFTAAASPMFSTVDGRSAQFHGADFMAALDFTDTTTGVRPQVKSCDLKLQATVTNAGTLAGGFGVNSLISGLQLRKLSISLR